MTKWLLSLPSPPVLAELPSMLTEYKHLTSKHNHRFINFLHRLDKLFAKLGTYMYQRKCQCTCEYYRVDIRVGNF